MTEKVNVFPRFKRHERLQPSHSRRHHYQLHRSVRIQLALDNLGAHLPHVELVDRVHFKGSAVEAAIFPPESSGRRVVLRVIFATRGQSIHIKVLEFVNAGDSVRIEHAERSRPTFENIVCKDVQLSILWLVLEHVNAFRHVSRENPPTLLNLYPDYRRHKILVLLLSEQLFLPKVVDSDDAADAGDKLACVLVEGVRNVLTRRRVQQFERFAAIRELVRLDEAKRATAGCQCGVKADACEKV